MSKVERDTAQMLFGKLDDMLGRVAHGIEQARKYLFSQQHSDGYWCGELEADTTLESDYIYYLFVLGKADPVRIMKLANYVRQRQLPDGPSSKAAHRISALQ